ncbi:MAG: hypothetical protein FJY91_00740 [Candidatus Harrisonbacteria bacterium]|nr:hypothetical protein [Candidatus Harrisonbacteria bacterium]
MADSKLEKTLKKISSEKESILPLSSKKDIGANLLRDLIADRLHHLFSLKKDWYVNIDSASVEVASLAALSSLMDFGETFLTLSLASGGYPFYSSRLSIVSRAYRPISYNVDPSSGLIDYDEIARLIELHAPKVIISGGLTYPRIIDFEKISKLAHRASAFHLADISSIAPLILAGLYPPPFKSTDLVLLDTQSLTGIKSGCLLSGEELSDRLARAVTPGIETTFDEDKYISLAAAFPIASSQEAKKRTKQSVKNASLLASQLKKTSFTLMTDGTDTDCLILDLRHQGLSGKEGRDLLKAAGIFAAPNFLFSDSDITSPSGLLLNTSHLPRGMKESEIKILASIISELLFKTKKPSEKKSEVLALLKKSQ